MQRNPECSPGEIHRSPSYPRGQLQVSLATQAPPFAQGGLHTTNKDKAITKIPILNFKILLHDKTIQINVHMVFVK